MEVLTQAYRTTCVPAENKIEAFIPSEYIGQELEVIILPLYKEDQPEYNAETLAAMQEARDIMDGKIQTKKYKTAAEMHADILSEEDD